jgi:hypothetical protein
LSSTERAHIPEWRGGAPWGLSSTAGSEVGGEVVKVVVDLKGEINKK